MEINWHLLTLLEIQCIHLLEVINQYFMLIYRKMKSATVSMNTVDIPNLDIRVWNWKRDLPQGNLLRSLTPPEIIRQRPF